MPSGAIVLAGGSGRRFKTKQPKQLMRLKGEPLFIRSLRVFASVPSIKEIVLVTPKGKEAFYAAKVRKSGLRKKITFVAGGSFRGKSVRNGFRALSTRLDAVLVHDAARPLVSRQLAERVLSAARKYGCVVPVWSVSETLKKEGRPGWVGKTISRKGMWLAQTPQGFSRLIAEKTLARPRASATDDVSLAELKKIKVKMVEGDPVNIKVTTRRDLDLCKFFLKRK